MRTNVTWPRSPCRTICAACWKWRLERCQSATWTTRWCLRAAASIAFPSSTDTATGFSTKTSFPAWQAMTTGRACQWSGVALMTTSIVLSSSSFRKSV